VGALAVAPAWWFVAKETRSEDDAAQSIALLRVAVARIKVFLGTAALVFFAAMLGVLLAHRR
jgi:hypothetical protein